MSREDRRVVSFAFSTRPPAGQPDDKGGRAPPLTSEPPPQGPWAVALRKLWRDRAAMVALAVFLVVCALCLMAPLYAQFIAGSDPFQTNLNGEIVVDGEVRAVLEASTEGLGLGMTPIGPTWRLGPYMLGADNQGRDVAARLLYGGRDSLLIAGSSTLITLVLATFVGVVAGYFGGVVDGVLSRFLDILWAFPIYLLAISLSIVLISKGLEIGPISITAGSLALPITIIGIVYVPYVARPIRGHVLSLMTSEFVLAAVGLGVPSARILLRDILPNVMTRVIVFIPLMMALNMLTESSLSFLSIGVQPPDASWGTIIQDGQGLLYSRPMVAFAPGLAIVLCVLTLNIFGDGVRDALDPKSKLRVG
ncbi:Binding-protein-dependent transport systems inner membrane component [Rhodospirillum rubrum ATCC 11170]|uniref:Binding-protein-dependent transport systems inner membrane component n=2 Tax=Rhodospirillum rubrum TaxID=1085 RepID=Q2RSB8_RHORT|nr:Binding-protein-dependent transport systems inner membrane component [Rhodospirillum rubrum ATCC 11170]MBK5954602.1 ABC transporter permease [Rhodospirillum rubrum]HAP98755.1 ABC transporter permease [Rhodospirillum rubrum]